MTFWSQTDSGAVRLDLEHMQGDTFARTLDLEEDIADWENWTLAIRATYANDAADNGEALVLLDEDDGIAVVVPEDEEEPATAIALESDEPGYLPARLYYYDVQAEKDGVIRTFVYGTCRILPHVTV